MASSSEPAELEIVEFDQAPQKTLSLQQRGEVEGVRWVSRGLLLCTSKVCGEAAFGTQEPAGGRGFWPAASLLSCPSAGQRTALPHAGLLRAVPLRRAPPRAMAPRVVSLWRLLLQQQQKSTQWAKPFSARSNKQWLPSMCRSQSHRDLAICGRTSGNSGERASGVPHSCSDLPQRGEYATMLPRAVAAAPVACAMCDWSTSGSISVSFVSEARPRAAIAASQRALLELLDFERVATTVVPPVRTT
mmetsp:Transcript_84359/g.154416  ORF Transcript_84359/g.154416 Transcript_84359/m.154416 type:complete len:246 (+) Transcript_84359:259-996(+)